MKGIHFLLVATSFVISCGNSESNKASFSTIPNDATLAWDEDIAQVEQTLEEILDAQNLEDYDDQTASIDYENIDMDSLMEAELIEFEKAIGEYCNWNDSILSAAQIIDVIADFKELHGPYIGIIGARSWKYAVFELLLEKASITELEEMINSQNPVARGYAFWGLTEKGSPNLFRIMCEHLDDTTSFTYTLGCLSGPQKVGDFFIRLAIEETVNGYEDYLIPTQNHLSKEEKMKLDSIILAKKDCHLLYKDILNTNSVEL